jgi:hypothetical protein
LEFGMLAHNQDENNQFDQSMGHTGTCNKKYRS